MPATAASAVLGILRQQLERTQPAIARAAMSVNVPRSIQNCQSMPASKL
jgi:hypothetical protein